MSRPAKATVDLAALKFNCARALELCPDTGIVAVILVRSSVRPLNFATVAIGYGNVYPRDATFGTPCADVQSSNAPRRVIM